MKLTFADAIKLAFKNYSNFRGSSTRAEYWWFILFNLLVTSVASAIDYAIGGKSNPGYLGNVVGLALFLPLLTLLIRRFRNAGVSPLWLLTWLIPFGAFVGWLVGSFQQILALANDFDPAAINFSETEAQTYFEQFFYNHPEIINLATQLTVILGLFALWALFEFIVTLLPTKKPKQSLVASTDY